MSQVEALESLESLLENFLERVVKLKQNQLQKLGGINRLDDIARRMDISGDFTEEIGNWFAEHSNWLDENQLKPAEEYRISGILDQIRNRISTNENSSPAELKIRTEIDRWDRTLKETRKITLKKGPETVLPNEPFKPVEIPKPEKLTEDIPASIARFDFTLKNLNLMFADLSRSRAHLLSVLDDSLKKAENQKNKEALILSAFIIYYLKLDRYKVGPYVKRLKEAEQGFDGGKKDA